MRNGIIRWSFRVQAITEKIGHLPEVTKLLFQKYYFTDVAVPKTPIV
jgi:hypothetical protein